MKTKTGDVQPTDEDRRNYDFICLNSQFASCPEKFLNIGDRVRAKFRIWDLPRDEQRGWGWVSAEKGELGTVVHVEKGWWQTVKFDNTGYSTCVSDFEVEKV